MSERTENANQHVNAFIELQKTFLSIGLSMYSKEFACKLLAYVYVYGGNNEAVVENKALYFAIKCCQQLLNIDDRVYELWCFHL